MSLAVDHVIVCVDNLDEAARRFEKEHGVVSIEGGRHRGHGTANRLIPLGENYIELLAVVAPGEAKTSVLGTWAMQRAAVPGAAAVCLGTDDIDPICERLGLEPTPMSRLTPDGAVLEWRLAGMKQAFTYNLPFFIQWNIADELHPGRIDADHPAGRVRLEGTTIWGNAAHVTRLREWAPDPRDLSYSQGERGVTYRLVTETPRLCR